MMRESPSLRRIKSCIFFVARFIRLSVSSTLLPRSSSILMISSTTPLSRRAAFGRACHMWTDHCNHMPNLLSLHGNFRPDQTRLTGQIMQRARDIPQRVVLPPH